MQNTTILHIWNIEPPEKKTIYPTYRKRITIYNQHPAHHLLHAFPVSVIATIAV